MSGFEPQLFASVGFAWLCGLPLQAQVRLSHVCVPCHRHVCFGARRIRELGPTSVVSNLLELWQTWLHECQVGVHFPVSLRLRLQACPFQLAGCQKVSVTGLEQPRSLLASFTLQGGNPARFQVPNACLCWQCLGYVVWLSHVCVPCHVPGCPKDQRAGSIGRNLSLSADASPPSRLHWISIISHGTGNLRPHRPRSLGGHKFEFFREQ